jgi:predicted AlkP superfamily phosphohydrolase/phosphomutase
MNNPSPRLFMVGLDSMPPDLLEKWCDEGLLPNIAALRKEATYGYIDSVADWLPGATWPTFASSSLPSVHGIHHFMQWDAASMRFRRPTQDWCNYTPFWHKLGEQGIPLIAFDLPFCYPKEGPPRVVEVHGWGLHDELSPPFSRPEALLRELSTLGRSALRPDVLGPRSDAMLRKELDGLVSSLELRVRVLEQMAHRFDWRVMLAVFAETHRAGHYFWTDRVTGEPQGGIKRVVMAIDAQIPRLRALVPDGRFVLFSLHGMGPNVDFDRFAEPLAAYLEPLAEPPTRRLDPVSLAHRYLPGGIRRAISAGLPTRLRDRLFTRYLAQGRDWSRTSVFVLVPDGKIYIRANARGREREGILSEHEVASYLSQITSQLNSMRMATGEPAVAAIARPVEVYGAGPRTGMLPDLMVKASPSFTGHLLRLPDGGEIHAPWRGWRDGDHTQRGFFIQTGPNGAPSLNIPSHDFARAMCESVGLTF